MAPIRKRLESAERVAEEAAKLADDEARARRLRVAIARAELARKRIDRLRKRYEDDAAFLAAADRLGFTARKQVAGLKRQLAPLVPKPVEPKPAERKPTSRPTSRPSR